MRVQEEKHTFCLFPLEEGLISINQLLATERAEVVAVKGRE